ncbi:hypothetical protein PSECIP111951_01718 [Pseudoalteromonas holothuriae]|uniref:GmrSD restriction endonucleases N-terminal domain-containing protein n=1 Tax=Pseudoalteromonas holothuriae TaxID=2963714 RepID=A0ABN8UKC1_9GAMM|nr:DUF262 domain-containing protein [Pseudoalteromonas sp. CIP111951]CAH9057683.1 hypothetical protein PSECIP111951_01718 [Pseudoalteromonas sp. CIP111951]
MVAADINSKFQSEMAGNLHVRSTSQSIDSLLTSRRKTIDYKAPYQRNYVWNEDKATFFIESILLGVEIPPLILFIHAADKKILEVIDGRQRYETIERFSEGKFGLRKNGLVKLKNLAGKKYSDLVGELEKYKRAFNNTTLRIIEFSSKNPDPDPDIQKSLEEKISKEIFRRYNTGITPLKKLEVKSARHEGDNFTGLMKRVIEDNDNNWVSDFGDLFLNIKPENRTPEKIMNKLRDLITLEYFPINIYASTSERSDVNEHLFKEYIESDTSSDSLSDTQQEKLESLIEKIEPLNKLKQKLGVDEWLIYQCVFWAFTVLENEGYILKEIVDDTLLMDLSIEIKESLSLFTGADKGFSTTTTERFKKIAQFFGSRLDVNFSDYLRSQRKHGKIDEVEFKEQRLARQEAETTTVENLILKMINNEYQLRPPYQRQEVINNKKASGIIESILLGIPLPTIFVYRRNDGVCEVVDGQQRLLSILGYIGEGKNSLLDSGVRPKTNMHSKKDKNFKLAKTLPILRDSRGVSFANLSGDLQDKIWDFELSIVYINEDTNPDFDPIDLFIRLNDKSYDIRDPSFEMWNSYAEPLVMDRIKKLAQKYHEWFYYIMDDRRMKLEELLLSLAYIDYESKKANVFEPIQIYQASGNHITFRVENPKIDHWLDKIESCGQVKEDALDSINNVELFIEKVEALVGKDLSNAEKAKEFDNLISLTTRARNQRGFYMLWLLTYTLDVKAILAHRSSMFSEMKSFLLNNKKLNVEESTVIKEDFQKLTEEFCSELVASC